jgi:hypothetical protein
MLSPIKDESRAVTVSQCGGITHSDEGRCPIVHEIESATM